MYGAQYHLSQAAKHIFEVDLHKESLIRNNCVFFKEKIDRFSNITPVSITSSLGFVSFHIEFFFNENLILSGAVTLSKVQK